MLLGIALELTEHILTFARPKDVASFAQTNRTARRVVYEAADDYLWRGLFLAYPFDDPRPVTHNHTSRREDLHYPWREQLCARVAAEQGGRRHDETNDFIVPVLRILDEMTAAPAPSYNSKWLDSNISKNAHLVPLPGKSGEALKIDDEFARTPDALARGRLGACLALSYETLGDAELVQLGLFRLFRGIDGSESMEVDTRVLLLREARRNARARVYNLSYYRRENGFAAMLPRARQPAMALESDLEDDIADPATLDIDWTHVHAQTVVVGMNVLDQQGGMDTLDQNRLAYIQPPRGLEHLRVNSAPITAHADERDWAGVQGQWRRLVCFMDYRDLIAYNEIAAGRQEDSDLPRTLNASYFDRPSFREATRLISMQIEPTAFHSADDPICTATDDPEYPPIEFTGTAFSHTMPLARMQGVVRRTRDGVVRWSWTHRMIHHAGHGWRSVGIQLGGLRSASGVIGTWTGADHEDDDPAGPFWMWKVPDNAPKLFFDNT